MVKYVKRTLLFFMIVTVIDLCVGYLGDYLQCHARYGKTKALNDFVMNDQHDVIIMGSSRAHHHYDTPFLSDTLGMDVYNAGYDGNGVVLAYGLAGMILERYRPRLVIYDVEPAFDIEENPNDNSNKRYIANLKPYFRNENVAMLVEDVSDEEWYKVHSGLLRYNSVLLNMLSDNIKRGEDNMRGYLPLQGTYKDEPTSRGGEVGCADSFKLFYMKKMVTMLQSNNVPLIVVASPKYAVSSSSAVLPVKKICEQNGVPFIDYYSDKEFEMHKEWFKDPVHLNEVGARVFSAKITSEIKNIININEINYEGQ